MNIRQTKILQRTLFEVWYKCVAQGECLRWPLYYKDYKINSTVQWLLDTDMPFNISSCDSILRILI